jgi:hypothetical protein
VSPPDGVSTTVTRVLGRVAAGPLTVRAVALGAGLAALVLSVPAWLLNPRLVVVMSVLALVTAVVPASAWVSVLEYLAVVVWLATTTVFRYEITPVQLLGLAVAIYLHHSACTLAAVIPADGVVAPRVLAGWAGRTGIVVAVSVGTGFLLLSLPGLVGRSSTVAVPLVGLAALVVAGLGLVRLARRPR